MGKVYDGWMGSFHLSANTVAAPASGALSHITAASLDAGVIALGSLAAAPLLGLLLLLLRPART